MRRLPNFAVDLGIQLLLLSSALSVAPAATLVWDSNASTSPVGKDGAGAWLATDSWYNAGTSSNVTWGNTGTDIAVLGNGGSLTSGSYRVTLASDVNLQGLSFASLATGNTQAYQIEGAGALNFGASNGYIEILDGSSSTEGTNRIQVTNVVAGNNVTIKAKNNTKLALINFSGNNTWTGSLTLDSSTSAAASEALFVQFSKRASVNTLSEIVITEKSTAVLSEAGAYTSQWKLAGTGANGRGAVRFDGNATVSGNITLTGNASIGLNTSVSAILTGNIGESGGARRLTISPQASGNTGRTLTLRGNNTFTGGLLIDGGIVRLESATALSSANSLTFQANATTLTHDRSLVMSGYDLTLSGLNAAANASNSVISNDTNTLITLTVNTAADTTSAYAGSLQGKLALTKNGAGTLNLSGASSHTALTTVKNGTLNLSHSQGLGSTDAGVIVETSAAKLRLSNNITVVGEHFQGTNLVNASDNNTWTGTIQTLSGLQTTLESTSGNLTLSGTIEGRSVASTTHTVNLTGAGQGEVSGVIQNVFQLNKQSSGSWLLSGANSYTTATAISGGNLQVGKNGVGQTGTGAVTVAATNAILSGSGLVRGLTTLTQGKILAGDTWGADMGILSFTSGLNLSASTASTVGEFLLGNAGSGDKWLVGGDLSINSASRLKIDLDYSYVLNAGDSWTLIDWNGNFLPGAGFNLQQQLILPDLSLLAGYNQHQWSLGSLTNGGDLTLSIITVPEPSKALLGMVAMLGMVGLRRRNH